MLVRLGSVSTSQQEGTISFPLCSSSAVSSFSAYMFLDGQYLSLSDGSPVDGTPGTLSYVSTGGSINQVTTDFTAGTWIHVTSTFTYPFQGASATFVFYPLSAYFNGTIYIDDVSFQ